MAKTEDEQVSWVPAPVGSTVQPEVALLWATAEEKLGFVPNVMRAYAYTPERFLAWWAHYDGLMRGDSGVSKAQREMIAVVVSATNRCHYCIVSHSAALRVMTGDPVLVDELAVNYRNAPLEPRERAMLDFAVKLTEEPFRVTRVDHDALLAAGWTQRDVADIAEVAAMFNFTNRMASALGWKPNEIYGSMGRPPDAWQRP